MSKLAVASMAIGEDFRKISEVSFPTLRAYAHRIGAEFWELPGGQFPGRHPHWEKLYVGRLLDAFYRVAWIDADALVSPYAPSIFNEVPDDCFAAFNEAVFDSRAEAIAEARTLYGYEVHPYRYFNAGVMVFSRMHWPVFQAPLRMVDGGMPEQTYVNAQVARLGLRFYDLGPFWNGFASHYPPDARPHLNVIHYAGWPRTTGWVDRMIAEMKADLARWNERS